MQGNLLADEVHLKFFKLCNHTLAHNNQNYFSRDLSKLSSIIIHFFTNAKLKCLRLQNNLENNAIKTVLNVISFQLTRPCKGVSKRTVTDPEVYNELEGGVIENRVRGVRVKKTFCALWIRHWNALIREEILPPVHDSLVLLVSIGLAIAVV